MARHRHGAPRSKLVGLIAVAVLLTLTLGLSGCVVAASTATFTDGALGVVTARQGVTADNAGPGKDQTLDEYGLFYSTNYQDVVDVDAAGSATGSFQSTIVFQPSVKVIRVVLSRTVAPGEVGTLTLTPKGLAPGSTYYYRFYSIGRDNTGVQWRTLYAVNGHKTIDPTLKSITLSAGKLAPTFSKTRYAYYTVLPATTKSTKVTVAPTAASSKVQMKIGTGAWSTVKYKTVALLKGQTKTVYVKVTASNNKAICTYSVKVTRKK